MYEFERRYHTWGQDRMNASADGKSALIDEQHLRLATLGRGNSLIGEDIAPYFEETRLRLGRCPGPVRIERSCLQRHRATPGRQRRVGRDKEVQQERLGS